MMAEVNYSAKKSESLKTFMTSHSQVSCSDDAQLQIVMIMRSKFEKGEIYIFLLPKQYKRSVKEKNKTVYSSQPEPLSSIRGLPREYFGVLSESNQK